mgnify:CR=1 FL=1
MLEIARMIAFLGWGSLVWDPRELPIDHQWNTDGPYVRIEFLRQSNNGRLTLVISQDASPVHSLWTRYSGSDLMRAREDLRIREGIHKNNAERHVGSWVRGDASPIGVIDLEPWAAARGIEAVVWTALPPKFGGIDGVGPTVEQAISYLGNLVDPIRSDAEQYVRRAPRQVDTPYRRRIEHALGWSCTEFES